METREVIASEVPAHVTAERERVRVLLDDVIRSALQTGSKVGHRAVREELALLRAAAERAVDVELRELAPLLHSDEASELYAHHAAMAALSAFEHDVDEHHGCDLVAQAEQLVEAFGFDLDIAAAPLDGERLPR